MRILGIDHGEKSLGLALSDPLHLTARPLGLYRIQGRKADRDYFLNLVREHEIGEIVVGLPLMMDGSPGIQVEKVRKFGAWLENALGIPVHYWDERLTTKEALGVLQAQNMNGRMKKRYKDQVSAAIILSAFLESRR